MSYCTIEDLQKAFGSQDISELTDPAFDGGDPGQAIEDAAAEIDARLGMRYSSPLPQSNLLRAINADLAACRLHDNVLPESLEKRCADRRKLLDRIADGKAQLPGATSSDSAETDEYPVYFSSGESPILGGDW